jgi:hypothetical protein
MGANTSINTSELEPVLVTITATEYGISITDRDSNLESIRNTQYGEFMFASDSKITRISRNKAIVQSDSMYILLNIFTHKIISIHRTDARNSKPFSIGNNIILLFYKGGFARIVDTTFCLVNEFNFSTNINNLVVLDKDLFSVVSHQHLFVASTTRGILHIIQTHFFVVNVPLKFQHVDDGAIIISLAKRSNFVRKLHANTDLEVVAGYIEPIQQCGSIYTCRMKGYVPPVRMPLPALYPEHYQDYIQLETVTVLVSFGVLHVIDLKGVKVKQVVINAQDRDDTRYSMERVGANRVVIQVYNALQDVAFLVTVTGTEATVTKKKIHGPFSCFSLKYYQDTNVSMRTKTMFQEFQDNRFCDVIFI